MKLKMLTRMAAMVAAGSLVVGLLAGCSVIPSKDGAADSAVATDTALILTQGDGMPALTNAEEFLNSVNVTPGGSAGRVGAASLMAGTIGGWAGGVLHLIEHERRMAVQCGMAAFFSALFRTPLAAPIFAMTNVNEGDVI